MEKLLLKIKIRNPCVPYPIFTECIFLASLEAHVVCLKPPDYGKGNMANRKHMYRKKKAHIQKGTCSDSR